MGMITKYIGKNTFKCQMCDKLSKLMFEWEGMLTGDKLLICYKCAKREGVGKWVTIKKISILEKNII